MSDRDQIDTLTEAVERKLNKGSPDCKWCSGTGNIWHDALAYLPCAHCFGTGLAPSPPTSP